MEVEGEVDEGDECARMRGGDNGEGEKRRG